MSFALFLLLGIVSIGRSEPAALPDACRAPGFYELRRQSERLNVPPVDEVCPEFTVFTHEDQKINLSFKDVESFEYIIAGRGHTMPSRFGHAMLGIHFKNSQILDLGFTAETLSDPISWLGGIYGRYPSLLNFQNDLDVVQKNTYVELRDMKRAPLVLTLDQRRLLFALLIERFWTYSGHYKFLVNNCASELLVLFKLLSAPTSSIQQATPDFLTPNKLLRRLSDAGFLDLKNVVTVFSARADMANYVSDFGKNGLIPKMDLDAYFRSPAKDRAIWSKKISDPVDRLRFQILETEILETLKPKLLKAQLQAVDKTTPAITQKLHSDLVAMDPQKLREGESSRVPLNNEIMSEAIAFEKQHRFVETMAEIQRTPLTDPAIVALKAELGAVLENLKTPKK